MLPHVPFDGWTRRALRAGLADIGVSPEDAEQLFPGGAADMIEAFCDLADRTMEEGCRRSGPGDAAAPTGARGDRAAARAEPAAQGGDPPRAGAAGAAGTHARLAAACTARTVDAIWHAAGDRSADFSWYTKRAILAAVYGATLLYWLRDSGDDDAATLGFLDRRLAGVGRIGSARRRVEAAVGRLRPA